MDEFSVREGVVFGHGGGRDLRCDVYAPQASDAPRFAVLLVHGGAWARGDRGSMRGFGERLAASGFVCVSPEYRLTGESAWPAQIADVKAAIRWCRSQSANLGIDATRIGAMGFSAGGHLALLAAGTPGLPEFTGSGASAGVGEQLAAVVAVYPPILFYVGGQRPSGATPARVLLGDAATEDAAREAGPLTYVRPGFPPVCLMHGTADKEVPPSASRVFYDALVRAGVPVELHMYAAQPHGFAQQPDFIDLIAAETAHFLQRQLGAAGTIEAQEAATTA
jgi:acetyl esterase/lipase